MTPRWTTDEDGTLWWGPTAGQGWLDHWQAGTCAEEGAGTPAFDALVAAVRDADTLRKAREIVAEADGWLPENMPTLRRLMVLLSAPQGEGT